MGIWLDMTHSVSNRSCVMLEASGALAEGEAVLSCCAGIYTIENALIRPGDAIYRD
jgi:hypothetical protein